MSVDGYDAPIGAPEEDVLQRWSFAREIAELAISAPKPWAIRIGVYGSWGTGKSSVINLCSRIVRARGHVAAHFSPWGHSDPKRMLVALADAALLAMNTSGLPVDGKAKRKLKTVGRVVLTAPAKLAASIGQEVGSIATQAKIAGHVASVVGPWLDELLADRAADFADIARALGDRRLVVFVDDVDRADPALLPRLLFALHEVLGSPGMSYVLALDPDVVSAALENHHAGFGTTTSFLEKIIQFPRWVPEPSREDLAALAMKEAAAHAPFMPQEVVQSRLELLPSNPRTLRTAIRNLWSARSEIERHAPDDIDWHLLLIVSLIRSEFPRLLHSGILAADITAELHREHLRATQSNNNLEQAQAERAKELVGTYVRDDELERATKLVLALVDGGFLWGRDRIREHNDITERPPVVTSKEFRACLNRFLSRPETGTIEGWIQQHGQMQNFSRKAVLDGLFVEALNAYRGSLEQAADSVREHNHLSCIATAISILHVTRMLLVEFASPKDVAPDRFLAALQAFRSWAGFATETYTDIRGLERALLLHLVNEASAPDTLLEQLAPWDFSQADDRVAQQALNALLVSALTVRVACQLEGVFSRPSALVAAIQSDSAAQRWTLFDPERFWNAERVTALQQLVNLNPSQGVAENCFAFLEKLVDERMEVGRWGYDRKAADRLLGNSPLVLTLWCGLGFVAPNVRYFRYYERLKVKVERGAGIELPEPRWWQRLREDHSRIAERESARMAQDGPSSA